jgi:hypothetical protein
LSDFSLQIKELANSRDQIRVIHYGCESWFFVKDRPVAISCIAVIDFRAAEEVAFSLTDHNDDPEKKLLEQFYKYIRESPDARYVHWNMRSSDYGFAAIDKRYKYLFGQEPPYTIPKNMRYDLDDLIAYRYGSEYTDHPKLSTLAIINQHNKRYFLSGKEEADKFESNEYGDIKRSITEKAHLIAFLTKRFLDGALETKNAGPRVRFAKENLDAVQIILQIGDKFKTISRQLKIRHAKRSTIEINDEYDFQDLFHALLRLFFNDIRAEEWVPSYAGGNKRTDFLLSAHSIAVELKHSRPSMSAKELGDQLVVDIANYEKHPGIRIVICLVFDSEGYIVNPAGIEKDLTLIKDKYTVVTKILT